MKTVKFSFLILFSFIVALLCSNYGKADYQAGFGGTSFRGLTRSTTIAEYDSTIDAAGNLLDISGSNYLQNSEALSSTGWTVDAGATVTVDQAVCPEGGANTAELITVGTIGGVAGVSQMVTMTAGQTFEPSIWIKRVSVSGTLDISQVYAASFGLWGINLASLPDTWVRIYRDSSYVSSVTNEFTLDGSNRAGMYLTADSGTVQFYACAAQIARTDPWRKGPGVYHPTTATIKPLQDMTPVNSPSLVDSYFQGLDGNRLQTKAFNGSNQQYTLASHDSQKIYDGNHTFTIVASSDAEINIFGQFSLTGGSGGGVRLTSVYEMKYVKLDGSYTANMVNPCGGGVRTDSKFHVMHVIKNGNYGRINCDLLSGQPVDVSNGGVDVTQIMYLGGSSGNYYDGNIQYFRIDAEALNDTQSFSEEEKILGILGYVGGNSYANTTFTRATTASVPFNNGTIGYVASGVPRVVDGYFGESLSQNMCLQSQALGTTWTFPNTGDAVSSNSATILAPDGTATADGMIGDADDVEHIFRQSITLTAVAWVYSVDVMAGNKNWIALRNNTVANTLTYFNIANCFLGTKGSAVTAGTIPLNGSWCRVWISFTGTAASSQHDLISAEANEDDTFIGDSATVNSWFTNVQMEIGSFPSSRILTTTTAITRNGDLFKVDPFKYTDSLPIGGETTWLTFDQDPTAATVLSNEGTYTWTTTGSGRKKITTEQHGNGWQYDGSTVQFWKASEAEFTPTGDFSIVAAFIPETPPTTYGYIFGKYNTTAERSYALYVNQTGGVTFAVSADGTQATFASKLLTGYIAGRPTFVVATYDYGTPSGANPAGDSIGKLYINDMSVVTDSGFVGPAKPNAENVFIGRSVNGSRFQGKMLYLAYYNGRIITPTEVSNMYDTFKQAWLLPKQLSPTDLATKLRVQFDYKYMLASAPATGYPGWVDISNTYGNSTYQKNRLYCYPVTTAFRCSLFSSGSTTEKYIEVTGLDHTIKHSVNYYLDTSNLANSTMTIDGVAGTPSSMTGTGSVLNFKDSNIKFGANSLGTVDDTPNMNGKISNVVIDFQ